MNNKKYLTAAILGLIGVTLFTFGQPKESLAAHWAQKGRQAERAGNYKEAFEDYRKAEALADSLSGKHPELRAALLEKLGDMSMLNGDQSRARQYFASAFQCWQQFDNGREHATRVLKKVRQTYGVPS